MPDKLIQKKKSKNCDQTIDILISG